MVKQKKINPSMGNSYAGYAFLQPLGGGQKKAPYSGVYKRGNVTYAIKSSLAVPGDDMAEVLGSRLLGQVFGDQIATCDFVSDHETVYVSSKFLNKFKVLKKHIGTKNFIFSKILRRTTEKDIYKEVKEKKLTQELANILCGQMWIYNLDCHTENIGYMIKPDGKQSIGTYDFGWGFANICKSHHHIVDPFVTVTPWAVARADHQMGGMPTGHFKDYSSMMIFNQEMVKAIDILLEKTTVASIHENIKKYIQDIIKIYKKADKNPIWVLDNLGRHIGLKRDPEFLRLINAKDVRAAQEYCEKQLTTALRTRRLSLQLLKNFISAEIMFKDPNKQNSAYKELRHIITTYNHILAAQGVLVRGRPITIMDMEEHIKNGTYKKYGPPLGEKIFNRLYMDYKKQVLKFLQITINNPEKVSQYKGSFQKIFEAYKNKYPTTSSIEATSFMEFVKAYPDSVIQRQFYQMLENQICPKPLSSTPKKIYTETNTTGYDFKSSQLK